MNFNNQFGSNPFTINSTSVPKKKNKKRHPENPPERMRRDIDRFRRMGYWHIFEPSPIHTEPASRFIDRQHPSPGTAMPGDDDLLTPCRTLHQR